MFGPVSVTAGTTPEILVLSPGHPNPFTASTNLQLTLPEPAAVVLEVFDARGRRVRTLDLGRQAAGAHSVSWDGLDDRGVRAAPGVFFLRVTAGEVLRTRKVILIAG